MTEPKFFKTSTEWWCWLDRNHAKKSELLVGFHKKATDKPSMTYQQALDEALAFGWIDGVRRGGDESWTIRFTPRRAGSYWSTVNTKRAKELIAIGRMHAAGLAAFEKRDAARTARYSGERADVRPSASFERAFRANKKAWSFSKASRPPIESRQSGG